MLRWILAAALAGCATTNIAPPGEVTAPGLSIVRDSTEAGPEIEAAAYVRLVNAAKSPDRFLGAQCECADEVQIHNTFDRSMHVLPHIDMPASGEIEIYPGGPTHLMLMGVRRTIAPGEIVQMILRFEHAPPLSVSFTAVENSREGWAAQDPRR